MSTKEKLVLAYQAMYEHTKEECAYRCKFVHSCCSLEYCDMAIEIAKEDWGTVLEPTEHFKKGLTKLPMMGQTGCTAAPHFRPLCTLHTCAMYAAGFTNDRSWDKIYFQIRKKIDKLELDRFQNLTRVR
jgi:hypothetical protein